MKAVILFDDKLVEVTKFNTDSFSSDVNDWIEEKLDDYKLIYNYQDCPDIKINFINNWGKLIKVINLIDELW